MSNVIPFNYGDALIRVVTDETTGEPLWVAKDICKALEIEDHRSAIRKLDADEKGVQDLPSLGGNQKTSVVTEAGLYNLIFRSNKPEAKPFKRWVTHEVLPTIRKTGSYGTGADMSQIIPAIASIADGMKVVAETQVFIVDMLKKQEEAKPLTRAQRQRIYRECTETFDNVAEMLGLNHTRTVARAFARLKQEFGVDHYTEIRSKDFEEAMEALYQFQVELTGDDIRKYFEDREKGLL